MLDVTEGNGYWPVISCQKDKACQAWKIATKESSFIDLSIKENVKNSWFPNLQNFHSNWVV